MFVIPTIYTAVDRYTRTIGVMSRATTSFADRTSAAGGRIERSLNKFGDKALNVAKTTAVAGGAIIAPLALATNAAIKFEDRLADVQKTTQLSDKALADFGNGILKLSTTTRSSIEDLLTIGEIGGQLGVASSELLAFTSASDKFAIALKADYGGDVEAAISSVGKLKNLFAETRKVPIADVILKAGSAINELGAVGAGTSQNINDFMLRIGALPDAIKPTLTNAAALGTFFEEVGIDAQIAAGGLSNFLLIAGKNLGGLAAQMHISEKAAKELFATDPTEFAKKFAGSLTGLAPDVLAKKLRLLKFDSQETIKVLGALGSNTQHLTELQGVSAAAFAKGTSLTEEAAKKNETNAAKLAMAKNNFEALAIVVGNQLLPILTKFLDKALPIVTAIGDWMTKHEGLMAVIVPAVGIIGGLLLALSGFATVVGVVSKAVAAWELVQGVLNITLTANPIGIIIVAIGLLVAAIAWVVSNTEGWGKQWDATVSWITAVFKAAYLELKIGFQIINIAFWDMVNGVIGAWYWAQNKLGIISDEQYNKNMAQIAAEKHARVTALKDYVSEYQKTMAKVEAGPGLHVSMKSDRKDAPGEVERGGVSLPALAPTADVRQNVLMQSIAPKEKDKLEVVVKAAPGTDAAVGNNTLGLPKLSSTMGFQNQK